MSKSNNSRGSLMALRPSLPRVAAVQTTPEMEERILGEAVKSASTSQAVFTERRKDELVAEIPQIHAEASSSSNSATATAAAMSRRKEPTVLMNAKIPYSLHSRLKRTAQFNDISMTDILIRAIEAEMESRRYAEPPEQWGTDKAR